MDPKLEYILKNRPSALRNSFIVMFVWFCAWLLSISFFLLAIILITGGFIYPELLKQIDFLHLMPAENQTEQVEKFNLLMGWMGIGLLVLGLLFLLIIGLCKMLAKRNLFILELDEWKLEKEEELKKKEEEKLKGIN